MADNFQIAQHPEWGNKKTTPVTPSKKIVVSAAKDKFKMDFLQGEASESGMNSFKNVVSIPLTKEQLNHISRGFIDGIRTKIRGVGFKKEEPKDNEIFGSLRYTIQVKDEGIYLLVGVLMHKIVNNFKNRVLTIKVYKVADWNAVTEIRQNKAYDESTCLFDVQIGTRSVVEGVSMGGDKVFLDTWFDQINAVTNGINSDYNNFLSSHITKKEDKPTAAASGTTEYKGTVSDDEDEFPF